jgi:hypothetical protein
MTTLPEGLVSLAHIFAEWSAPAPASIIYVFGSRVRGDHRPDSDVDFHVHYQPPLDTPTAIWATHQHATAFADLRSLLPGPPGFLDPLDTVAVAHVMKAEVVHSHSNVRCVWLPRRGDDRIW